MAAAPDGQAGARLRVLGVVRRYPGLHLREVHRQAGTSTALAEYHLNLLERWGLVTSLQQDGYRRFFPVREGPPVDEADRPLLALLRHRIPLGVALLLLERGAALHGDLVETLRVGKSTLSYHLARLEKAGLVGRRGRTLELRDRDRVLRLLKAHQPMPDLVMAYSDLWLAILDILRKPE